MMKLWILICYLLFASCHKDLNVPCPNEDEDQGLIVASYFATDFTCDDTQVAFGRLDEGIIIDTEEEFQSRIAPAIVTGDLCEQPIIDFSQFTLLGLSTEGSGCSRTYRKSVLAKGGELEFEVTVRECGGCEPLALVTHWVTIPKIESGTKVQFTVRIQKFNS